MSFRTLRVVILAAGLGKRMKSDTIKVLHPAGGRALIDYVIDLARDAGDPDPIVVVGHQRDRVTSHLAGRATCVVQEEQLGTGHAVLQAAGVLEQEDLSTARVLILSGDVPLTRQESIQRMIDEHEQSNNALTLLTMVLDDPALYGRIVRDENGSFLSIVEAKDASPDQLEIREVNAGIYLFDAERLFRHLRNLSTDNAQGEYYLTDLIQMIRDENGCVGALPLADPTEALGVNSRSDIASVEREVQKRKVLELMDAGVTFHNSDAVHLDWTVSIGQDTVVYPFVTIEGNTTIGSHCVIEPGVHLRNVRVGDGATIKSGSVAEDAEIGDGAAVGPMAHLRPGTKLGQDVKVGNFVETKKAIFGKGAKASHLSYIGDAEVGAEANIGAGTITCNYDGVNKHKTTIGSGAFIGSDTQLVAPVKVGDGAYVGAGSTITKDVPPGSLALSRTPQKIMHDWVAKKKAEQEEKEKS